MKKSSRPFTVEVKRSRLPSANATFQRYVVAFELAEARTALQASQPRFATIEVPRLPSAARILPDLSGEKNWIEEPVSHRRAVPDPIEPCETIEMPVTEASPPISHMMVSPAALTSDERKRVKRPAKTAEDLPRGERWKRRIPQVAW